MASSKAAAAAMLLILFMTLMTCSSREFPAEAPQLDCFAAISEMRSCSNEIAAYFANGTIDISPPCCEAINTIVRRCWPAVLGVIGLDPNQTDTLRGYCDAAAEVSSSSYVVFGTSLSPSPSPAMN